MEAKNEYRRSIDEYRPTLPIERKIKFYWVLVALRFILTLIPQTGYIHPDEYFQFIEPISGDYFDIDVHKPWEFNSTFPIRTALIPKITVGVPYFILRTIFPYVSYYLGVSLKTPYFLVIFPRILMCCLSFGSDYCLYKICCMYGQNYRVRLIIYGSSFVMLVYATRTFSNSVELLLLSVLLYYTSLCMAYSEKVVIQSDYFSEKYDRANDAVDRVKYYKLKASLPPHSLNHCFEIATITVVGIFNRPTFIAFALAPVFFWLQRGLGSRSVGFKDFHVRVITFIACGIPVALLLILVDSFYFGYLTMAEIGILKISINNFVVTPINFLKYNMNSKNLEQHGLHPYYLHFLVNVPLLYNVLGVIGLFSFCKMLYSGLRGKWLDLPRIQSIVGLMTTSFISPILLLSIFPHQESRFIIPVILPLVFLYAPNIGRVPGVDTVAHMSKNHQHCNSPNPKQRTSKLQMIWFTCNILLTLFYGFVHQAGVLPLTSRIAAELKSKPELTHIHLYTSHTYSLPTALLHLRNTQRTHMSSGKQKYKLVKDFYFYEERSESIEKIRNSISTKLRECEEKYSAERIPYRLYYAFPAPDLHEFTEHFSELLRNNTDLLHYRIVNRFYPHISTEKLPLFQAMDHITTLINLRNFTTELLFNIPSKVFEFLQEFQLILVRIEYPTMQTARQ